jgi:hypothetical protein
MPYYNKKDNEIEIILDNGETFNPATDWNGLKEMFGFSSIYAFYASVIPLENQVLKDILSNQNGVTILAQGGGTAKVTVGPFSEFNPPDTFEFIIAAEEVSTGNPEDQDTA